MTVEVPGIALAVWCGVVTVLFEVVGAFLLVFSFTIYSFIRVRR